MAGAAPDNDGERVLSTPFDRARDDVFEILGHLIVGGTLLAAVASGAVLRELLRAWVEAWVSNDDIAILYVGIALDVILVAAIVLPLGIRVFSRIVRSVKEALRDE